MCDLSTSSCIVRGTRIAHRAGSDALAAAPAQCTSFTFMGPSAVLPAPPRSTDIARVRQCSSIAAFLLRTLEHRLPTGVCSVSLAQRCGSHEPSTVVESAKCFSRGRTTLPRQPLDTFGVLPRVMMGRRGPSARPGHFPSDVRYCFPPIWREIETVSTYISILSPHHHTFSAFWLRSSVVSVLISVKTDMLVID